MSRSVYAMETRDAKFTCRDEDRGGQQMAGDNYGKWEV